MEATRVLRGFGWGVVATIAMSIPMLLGAWAGVSPIPKPIPAAIVGKVFGEAMPKVVVMILAAASHLAYGGTWGAILAVAARPVTLWKGLGLGVFLWLVMELIVLPWLGWGPFGVAISPRIAIATLVLHLIYGATVGWLMDRNGGRPPERR